MTDEPIEVQAEDSVLITVPIEAAFKFISDPETMVNAIINRQRASAVLIPGCRRVDKTNSLSRGWPVPVNVISHHPLRES